MAQVAPRRPNVLVILCEGWRRQARPGAAVGRLAAEGVAFTRAYAVNPSGGPSRAALHTARYSHAVSVAWDGQPLAAEYACLADGFGKAGYETGFVGKWDLDGATGARRRGYAYWADGGTAEGRATLGVEFLRKPRTAPYFLFMSLGVGRGAKAAVDEGMALRENVPTAKAAEARRGLTAYGADCLDLDAQVGRLLAAAAGADTLVVFTSDRGAMLGSHGLEGAGVFYEESAGVPLVMRWAGKLTAGTQQDWLFSNVDMAPTLRGLCGVEGIEEAQGEDRSALILGGGNGTRPESVYLQGELGTPQEWRMVIRGWDKLVVDRALKVTHLFNLAQDPFEKDNLVVDRASIRRQEELLALMRRWIIKTADRVPYPGAARR